MFRFVCRVAVLFLLFLLLLLLLPVRVRIRYDEKLQIYGGLGPVSVRLFPARKSKKKKTKASEGHAVEDEQSKQGQHHNDELIDMFERIFSYARLAIEGLSRVRKCLVVRKLNIHFWAAGEDAAQTALLYGRAAAGISALYPTLERNVRLKDANILVDADFESNTSRLTADVEFMASLLQLLLIGVVLLNRFRKLQRQQGPQKKPEIQKEADKFYEQYQ